jgi:arylsulfatase A-like enzyme
MRVLVIIARGLQASALSCYGNPWIDSPALDALAAEGVVFDQHFADAADPAEVRRVWRSGRYATPGADLLAALRQRGITSHLIVDASRPAPPHGEDWDRVEIVEPQEDQPPLETTLTAVQAALDELKQRDDWLLWVEFATLLQPWEPPEEYLTPYFEDEPATQEEEDEEEASEPEPMKPFTQVQEGPIDPDDNPLFVSLHSSYAAVLTYLDGAIGRILDHLEETLDQTLIVVTTDVGPSLGEHGVVNIPAVHEENIHLPLLMRLPGADAGGRRVPALTQTVDLAPTLADVFEVLLQGAEGFTLLPLVYGDAEKVRDFACAWLPNAACLRTLEWALVLPPEQGKNPAPQLFVKPEDRWEVNDVAQHHQELTEELERNLRTFLAAIAQLLPPQADSVP